MQTLQKENAKISLGFSKSMKNNFQNCCFNILTLFALFLQTLWERIIKAKVLSVIFERGTIMCTPPLSAGGIEPQTKFLKREEGLDRTSAFREEFLRKRG